MLTVALICLAFLHEPAPADFVRFGELTPARWERFSYSPMRERYFAAGLWLHVCHRRNSPLCERAPAMLDDAEYRWACWDACDDLCNANCFTESRLRAAQRLHKLLGPVNYFFGRMPEPWPEEK